MLSHFPKCGFSSRLFRTRTRILERKVKCHFLGIPHFLDSYPLPLDSSISTLKLQDGDGLEWRVVNLITVGMNQPWKTTNPRPAPAGPASAVANTCRKSQHTQKSSRKADVLPQTLGQYDDPRRTRFENMSKIKEVCVLKIPPWKSWHFLIRITVRQRPVHPTHHQTQRNPEKKARNCFTNVNFIDTSAQPNTMILKELELVK